MAPGGTEVLVPGEPEARCAADHQQRGLELAAQTRDDLEALGKELRVQDALPF